MFHHTVAKYIEREQLFSLEDKVLVALSGGADSVALLRVLLQAGYRCEAAHCNFHLRGEESLRDEEFVKKLCQSSDIPLHIVHFETEKYAREHGLSVEMAARELRYDWFEQLRRIGNFDVIAVAHHRDDSVETFLLNLIRGTGINGLHGIRAKNGAVVRPLLQVTRQDILDYLRSLGQEYVTDSTNLKDEYVRNKIRLHILPLMESINPSVKESIAATAARLEEVSRIYNKEMEEGIRRVKSGDSISITDLLAEPAPKSLLYELLLLYGFHTAQAEEVFRSLRGQPGKQFFSPEWCLLKDRDSLLLHRRSATTSPEGEEILLLGDGEWKYGNGKTIRVTCMPYAPGTEIPKERRVACLDARKLTFPLTLRKWRAGDSFVPFGMKGRKLISDYLTDRKLSLREKEEIFLVCSGDKTVWVAGERIDNRFRVDASTSGIVLLEIW